MNTGKHVIGSPKKSEIIRKNFILINNSSNQELWKSVRSLLGNGKSTNGLPKDITCSDLNDHFTSVGAAICESSNEKDLYWRGPSSMHTFKFTSINEHSILKFL